MATSGPLGDQIQMILNLWVKTTDEHKLKELSRSLNQLSKAEDNITKTTSRMSIATNIARINQRDFGSTLLIQGIQARRAREELEQGFFTFEKLTQQVTVLDEEMRGLRGTVARTANQIAQDFGLVREEAAQALVNVTALGIEFEDATRIVRIAAQGAAAGMGSIDNAA